MIPDVLANPGGVTVSYFEWVQDISAFFWSEEEINARLERIMREAFTAVRGRPPGRRASACARPPSCWAASGADGP